MFTKFNFDSEPISGPFAGEVIRGSFEDKTIGLCVDVTGGAIAAAKPLRIRHIGKGVANSRRGGASAKQDLASSRQDVANSKQGLANSKQGVASSKPVVTPNFLSKNFAVTTKRDVLQPTPENTFHPRKSWNDVRANLPGRASAASVGWKVFGSSAPAQLIDLVVAPVCAPVAGTFAPWVSNTGNDPFRHKATGASSYHVACTEHLRSRILVYTLSEKNDRITFTALAGLAEMWIGWSCAGWGDFIYNPPTYGFAARHDSYIGTFGRGAAVYGPYGGAGGFAAYNPRTGTYARGGAVDGPYGETVTTTARGNEGGTRIPRSRSRRHGTTPTLRRGTSR